MGGKSKAASAGKNRKIIFFTLIELLVVITTLSMHLYG